MRLIVSISMSSLSSSGAVLNWPILISLLSFKDSLPTLFVISPEPVFSPALTRTDCLSYIGDLDLGVLDLWALEPGVLDWFPLPPFLGDLLRVNLLGGTSLGASLCTSSFDSSMSCILPISFGCAASGSTSLLFRFLPTCCPAWAASSSSSYNSA